MKTKAVRLYGVGDLRLEEFELPKIKDDEILAHIFSDSICMSTYKAACQGAAHKRVPDDVAENPVIIGHEFCGEIVEIGEKWRGRYEVGARFVVQTALNYKGSLAAPGYSYKYIGGAATYVVIPHEVMEMDCLLPYNGEAYFYGSLSEPMSCIVGGYHANYHTKAGSYNHEMGIRRGGNMAILAGAGPMGLGAVDYAINCDRRPALVVVTDIDAARLARAEQILSPAKAEANGVKLMYVNTAGIPDATAYLRSLTDGKGYDDVFVYVPVRQVAELGNKILAFDGCMNFFAGPTDSQFKAEVNLYEVHYTSQHIVGTTGGNNDDLIEANDLAARGRIEPAVMVTHVGGIDSIIDATLNLPKIPGGKKLTYTQFNMPLTAIEDFGKLGETDPLFKKLDDVCKKNRGLWSAEAERVLFEHFGVEA